MEPFTIRQDFQENSLGQWASYPPVQDVGYDPSLSPTSDYGAPGGRSLMRIVRPVTTGAFRLGFIRRLDAASGESTRVRFSYRLKPSHPGDRVEIGFAGSDGRRYTAHVPVAAGGWSQAEAPFPDLPSGVGLEAIYIVASVRDGDPDIDYRFIIDDVELQAARETRFTVELPRSSAIFPWKPLVASQMYQPGDTVQIRASSPVRLAKAECTLKDQNGRVVARGPAGGFEYTIAATDPAGVWRAELLGETGDGREIATQLRLIVRRRGPAGHPRLYFGEADRQKLLDRTRDPRTAKIWAGLMKTAAASRDSGPVAHGGEVFSRLDPAHLLPTLLGYFDVLTRASSRITYNSLAAWVTGDTQARDAATSALLDVARWRMWAPPWFEAHGQHTYYPAGQLSSEAALGYDLLYPGLSEPERKLVRSALVDRGIVPTSREYVLDNRIMAGTSNWIGHTVGGAIVAAAAIQDDDDRPELNTLLGGLLLKLEDHLAASYLADGSYGEGISYQEFDLLSTTLALNALERVYGIDYWSRSHVAKSLTFPLYTLAEPVGAGMDMGDSHPPSGYTSAPVVARSGDPVMRWYYDRFAHRSLHDFLFFPEALEPRPPSQPVSRVFENKGNTVFRTGWDPDAAILQFRAGPNHNHNHADQGSFLLRAWGENLAVEAGPAHYYNDPYYAGYFTQAAGHNTILVDGNPASQAVADTAQYAALNSYPRILDAVATGFFDAVGADIAPVYSDRLERFTRRIVFVKPRYFVIWDELAAKGSPARFDWRLHVNDRDRFTITPGHASYRGEKAAMSVRIFEPSSPQVRVLEGHIHHSTFNPNTPKTTPPVPGILQVGSAAAQNARFLTVLAPGCTPDEAAAVTAGLRRAEGAGCAGVSGAGDLVMFRYAGARECRYQEWVADAAAWTKTADVLSGELVTRIAQGAQTIFSSNRPVSFAAQLRPQSITLATVSDSPARIRIYGASVEVPAGRHETTISRPR